MPARIKLLTGTYILQTNRAKFNRNAVSPVCTACHGAEETVEHFILQCPALQEARIPVLQSLKECLGNSLVRSGGAGYGDDWGHRVDILGAVLDCSRALPSFALKAGIVDRVEFHARRLIYRLHTARLALCREASAVS